MLILLLACAFTPSCQPRVWNLRAHDHAACGSAQTARVEHIGADDYLVCDCPGNAVEVGP